MQPCVVLVVALCYVSICGAHPDEQWVRTDVLVTEYDTMYSNIALTVEDASNQQKRAFSIIISGVYKYMTSGGDSVEVDIDEPADVIVSDVRTILDVLRSVIDPSINLVKKACRPDTPAKKCAKSLVAAEQKQIEACSGFTEHIQARKEIEEVFNTENFRKLLCNMVKYSREEDDDVALEFLDDIKEGKKHKEAMTALVNWLKSFNNGDYPCNLPPGTCTDDTDDSNETETTDKPQETTETPKKDKKKEKPKKKIDLEKMYYQEISKQRKHHKHY